MAKFITVKDETRQYGSGESTVYANHNVSFEINSGEYRLLGVQVQANQLC